MAPSITGRSIDNETRILQSNPRSMDKANLSSYNRTRSGYEATHWSIDKSTSSSSFMDTVSTGFAFLTKSYDHNVSFTNTWDDQSTAFDDPEAMFPPYVSIFSENEAERQHKRNESSGLYLFIVFS